MYLRSTTRISCEPLKAGRPFRPSQTSSIAHSSLKHAPMIRRTRSSRFLLPPLSDNLTDWNLNVKWEFTTDWINEKTSIPRLWELSNPASRIRWCPNQRFCTWVTQPAAACLLSFFPPSSQWNLQSPQGLSSACPTCCSVCWFWKPPIFGKGRALIYLGVNEMSRKLKSGNSKSTFVAV